MQAAYICLIMERKTYIFLSLLIIFISSFVISSCEVEFDPNDDWKETTIVYGILDQDADTIFIRVQKCFVGKGNYIQFAKQKDSIYYKSEDLDVRMYAYFPWDTNGWDTTRAQKRYSFIYTESYKKPEGGFYSEVAPVYYCVTKNNMSADLVYRLEVRNLKTGNFVYSKTSLVADYKIIKPTGTAFGFPLVNGQNILIAGWYTRNNGVYGDMARLFQPSIRFNFMENGEPAYVDLDFKPKSNPYQINETEITYYIYSTDVLSQIKSKVSKRGAAVRSFFQDTPCFEIFIYGCNDALSNYISNNQTSESLVEKPLYTNINNGIGIFASRRLHIKKGYTQWDSRFEATIKGYDIGF